MRLFGKVDGLVNRFDRAGWLTMPFDLAFTATAPPTPPVVTIPTQRLYNVPFEDRVLGIPLEDRVLETPFEDRVLEVRPE